MAICGLAMLGCGIPALVLGHQAHAVLRRPEVDSGRTGLALAAKILGIIGVALGSLLVLVTAAIWVYFYITMQSMTGAAGGGTTP